MRLLSSLAFVLVLTLPVVGCASLGEAGGSNRVDTLHLTSPLTRDSLWAGSYDLLQAHHFWVEPASDGVGLTVTNEGDSSAAVVLRMRWVLEEEPWDASQSRLIAAGTCRRRATDAAGIESASAWMPATWLGANSCFTHMINLLEQLPHYRIWYEHDGGQPPLPPIETASWEGTDQD